MISSDFLWDFENYIFLKTTVDSISNQKINVSICTDICMAAILDFSKWLPENAYFSISELLNVTER